MTEVTAISCAGTCKLCEFWKSVDLSCMCVVRFGSAASLVTCYGSALSTCTHITRVFDALWYAACSAYRSCLTFLTI